MNPEEIMLLHIQARQAEKKVAEKRQEALRNDRTLRDLLMEEIGRFLLSCEDPEAILWDEEALREAIRQKLYGKPWDAYNSESVRSLYDPASAKFRAKFNATLYYVLDWIAAEREACAKELENRAARYDAEEKGCWNDGESAGNALREAASKIRARGGE